LEAFYLSQISQIGSRISQIIAEFTDYTPITGCVLAACSVQLFCTQGCELVRDNAI